MKLTSSRSLYRTRTRDGDDPSGVRQLRRRVEAGSRLIVKAEELTPRCPQQSGTFSRLPDDPAVFKSGLTGLAASRVCGWEGARTAAMVSGQGEERGGGRAGVGCERPDGSESVVMARSGLWSQEKLTERGKAVAS